MNLFKRIIKKRKILHKIKNLASNYSALTLAYIRADTNSGREYFENRLNDIHINISELEEELKEV